MLSNHEGVVWCREVINTDLAGRLGVKAQPNTKFDNFLHDSVQMGYKTTVAAGCMVRPQCPSTKIHDALLSLHRTRPARQRPGYGQTPFNWCLWML